MGEIPNSAGAGKTAQILNENPDGNLEEYLTWIESQILEVTQPALSGAEEIVFRPWIKAQ